MQTHNKKNFALLKKIDAIADRFEAEWNAHRRPQIEDWISGVKASHQPRLLAELIAIELEWRAKNGELLVLDEYSSRFPDQKRIVEKVYSVWENSSSMQSTGEFKASLLNKTVSTKSLTPSESLSSGNLFLDRFQLQEKLGQGGFGFVYKAYDIQLGRSVALKVPHQEASDETKLRFLSEARSAGKLKHDHIVRVFDGGNTEGTLYIVCELIDGKDLSQTIKADSPSLKQLIRWIRDAASGLAYAHREHVVHRDVKPTNLLVSSDNRILVADFGLARRYDDHASITIDGSVFGTPAYMSPEQAAGDTSAVGPASDQYSLGVVLYEILSGRLPFHGENIQQILQLIQNHEAPPPQTLNPSIPKDLEAICQKSMSRAPSDRYADLTAFADDLQRWLNNEPVLVRPVSFTERMRRRIKRHPLISALTVATITLLIATGITGAMSWYRGHQIGTIQTRANKVESQLTTQKKVLQSQEKELADSHKTVTQIQKKVEEKSDAADRDRYRVLLRQISEGIQRGRMQPTRLRRLLDECPEQLRDWEWFYFDHLLQPKSQLLLSSKRPLRDAVLSPDGLHLAAIDDQGNVSILSTTGGHIEHQWQSKALQVQQIAWDPSGKRLAIGDKLNKLRIWDASTGQLLSTFSNLDFLFGATAREGIVVAPGVSQLIKNHLDTLRKNSIKQNQKIAEIQKQKLEEALPGLFENNPLRDVFLDRRDPLNGVPRALHSLQGYGWAVTFDSTGNRVAVGGDRFIQIWDIARKMRTHLLLATKNTYVTSLDFSSDDRRLLVGTYHGETIVLNCKDGAEILRKEMNVFHTHFTPVWGSSDELFYVPDTEGEVGVITLADHLLRTPTERHRGKTNAVGLSSDGKYLATAGTDHTIRVWYAGALQLAKLFLSGSEEMRRLQFFANNSKLMSCSTWDIRIWDIDSMTPQLRDRRVYRWEDDQSIDNDPIQEVSIGDPVKKIAIGPENQLIALATDTGFTVRELSSGRKVISYSDSSNSEKIPYNSRSRFSGSLQFDPQGRWLAAAIQGSEAITQKSEAPAKDKKIHTFGAFQLNRSEKQEPRKKYDLKIWKTSNWESHTLQLSPAPQQSGGLTSLAVNTDGNFLAYCLHNEIFILNAEDLSTKQYLKTDSPVRCLDFSPSSKALALGCQNGQIQIISLKSGNIERHFEEDRLSLPDPRNSESKSITDLEFSPDGKLLATSGKEGKIILWNMNTGTIHSRLQGHFGRINSLTFHPTGTRLVSSSIDHTIRIWNIKSGEEIGLLSDLPRNNYIRGDLVFTKDGREFFAAENGLLVRFDAGPSFLDR